jgi:hypothetical protein
MMMWTSIISETYYFTWIREARDENAIRGPKSVLWKLRKNPQYFAGKLLILQQQRGLDILVRSENPSSVRYRGYFVFPSIKAVKDRFQSGQPLSCFCLDENRSEFHVAYLTKKRKGKACQGGNDINYLTFLCRHGTLKTCETGVRFCRFDELRDNTKHKDAMNITDYALMLPYRKVGLPFQHQFTLVYSDWTVLTWASCEKGHVALDYALFGEFPEEY